MRFSRAVFRVITLVLFAGTLCLGFYSSQYFPALQRAAQQHLPKLGIKKQVNLIGLKNLEAGDLALNQFSDKSLLWWLWNRRRIEAKLLENTWLESARLESCGISRPTCIDVRLKEREPIAVASLNQSRWIVGSDGGFIRPIPDQTKLALPLLEGFGESDANSETTKARLKYALSALEVLRQASDLEVSNVKLESNGELKMRFHGVVPTITFGLAGESAESLEVQAKRLNIVLSSLQKIGRPSSEIDLAFNNLAVVKPLN